MRLAVMKHNGIQVFTRVRLLLSRSFHDLVEGYPNGDSKGSTLFRLEQVIKGRCATYDPQLLVSLRSKGAMDPNIGQRLRLYILCLNHRSMIQ